MTNKNKYLKDLSKKLSAEKFRDELNKAYFISTNHINFVFMLLLFCEF